MKKKLLYLFLIIPFFINAQNKGAYIDTWGHLHYGTNKNNQEVYTFGNNVKLRSESNTKSEVLELIKIGEKVLILDGTYNAHTYEYNGIDWSWFKVKYKNKTGYVIGGLLSQETQKTKNYTYVTSFSKINETYKLLVRVISNNKKYVENSIKFYKNDFYMEVSDNKGIQNIEDMVILGITNRYTNDRIKHYFFNNGKSLEKAIEVKHSEDGWSHLFLEEVIFPNDKEGEKNKIMYKLHRDEQNQDFDTFTQKFTWEGKELKPNIPK